MMLLNTHWKTQIDNAFKILNRSKIDYSPATCCFTPALPYPRSLTPLACSKPGEFDLTGYQLIFYIHIPFCSRRCTFCPYFVHTCTEIPDDYMNILVMHIRQILERNVLPPIFCLTFGGGSPNILSNRQLKKILDLFDDYIIETNIEVHPECSSQAGYFAELAQIGITSVSVGLQSSDDTVLKLSNRGHNLQMVHQIVSDIRTTPLLLNIDIMYGGLYGETMENAYATFLTVFETFRPDLINAYRACFHEGVPENARYKQQPDKYPDARRILEITALMHQLALRNNYSYTGHAYFVRGPIPESANRHKRLALLAAGPGTYSYVFDEHNYAGFIFFAPYHMQQYCKLVSKEQHSVERIKAFDEDYIARWGAIHDLKFGNLIEDDISQDIRHFLQKLSHLNLMCLTLEGFKLTDSGRCIEDLIYAALMPRNMWRALAEKKKRSDYTVDESKYDWFFNPDVVLNFQDFVRNAI